MAGELRLKQFVDNEVKPIVRNTIPEILSRLAKVEQNNERLMARLSDLMKPERPTDLKSAKKKK